MGIGKGIYRRCNTANISVGDGCLRIWLKKDRYGYSVGMY